MQLEHWIAGMYLDATRAASCAAEFAASRFASVVLDDFLQVDKLAALKRLFSTEGRFDEYHTIWKETAPNTYGREQKVSAEAWSAVPVKRRAASDLRLVSPKPEYRLGRGVLTHLKFFEMARSTVFMDFLGSVTGITPVALTGIQTRIMISGHYVYPHTDEGMGRSLCAIFYVNDGWQSGFGGRFRHRGRGGEIAPIDPISNRFLLFAPQGPNKHDVEPITGPDGWRRWSYTLWFGEPQE